MECLAKNWVPAFAAEDHGTLADDAFDHAVGNGSFTFWWQPHGLKYGIRRSADDDVRFGRTIVCNVSRGIVPNLRMRYARVDAVLITAPVDVLSARLAGRARSRRHAGEVARTQRYVHGVPRRLCDRERERARGRGADVTRRALFNERRRYAAPVEIRTSKVGVSLIYFRMPSV
jgi:ribose 1,5-bisphosphokinase